MKSVPDKHFRSPAKPPPTWLVAIGLTLLFGVSILGGAGLRLFSLAAGRHLLAQALVWIPVIVLALYVLRAVKRYRRLSRRPSALIDLDRPQPPYSSPGVDAQSQSIAHEKEEAPSANEGASSSSGSDGGGADLSFSSDSRPEPSPPASLPPSSEPPEPPR